MNSLHKGRSIARPRAVMHLELFANNSQSLGHTKDGCYPDAACQQDAALCFVRKREMVFGRTYLKQISLFNALVHCLRTASRLWVFEDADQIAIALRRIV